MSLLQLQQGIERSQQAKQPDMRARLLTLSWFEPDKPTPRSERQLHQRQQSLARRYQAGWYSASTNPMGNSAAIRFALNHHAPFSAITLCGHGQAHTTSVPFGIKLADAEPWVGQGCVLDHVELLILISCSVGRTTESQTRDIEGLVVELAIHRARAVLACRWPVQIRAAVAFANTVLEHYLGLRSQLGSSEGDLLYEQCLRARAVNLARKTLILSEDDAYAHDLSSLAALELYGLG